jgi:hypothetical protein
MIVSGWVRNDVHELLRVERWRYSRAVNGDVLLVCRDINGDERITFTSWSTPAEPTEEELAEWMLAELTR